MNQTDRMALLLLVGAAVLGVLAAASLADLGYAQAGDIVGGFEAWRRAGLPTIPAPEPPESREQEGMGPPET